MSWLSKKNENKKWKKYFEKEKTKRKMEINGLGYEIRKFINILISSHMLAKQYRLTKNKDFEKVTKEGQAIFSREIGLKWIKNNLSVSRFGIIVSLKIDKKAVVRNKIKRRIRAIIFQNLKTIKSGYDIIIITKPEIKNLNYWQLKNKIEQLLKRVNLC